MSVSQWADVARAAAANPEHPWDVRALDWPLTRDSVVVEVGGYVGRWALQIAERYAPRLYVFEPQPWAAATCRAVLGNRATVLDYALGVEDGPALMDKWGTDGCTLEGDGDHLVAVREAGAALAPLGPIDLMLVNIEGYEYTLIPHLLARGIRPRRLMVQLHVFADPDGQRGVALWDALTAAGYTIAWQYTTTLVAWEVQ